MSCGHFVVGYGYGCNSAGFLLLHHQVAVLRLQKGLRRWVRSGDRHRRERVTPPQDKCMAERKCKAERRLTDSIEVLYVHTTIKVEDSTEGVERDGGGERREGNGVFFHLFFDFLPANNWV